MNLSKTILKNTLSNWAGSGITTLVTILMTPYLIKHLGQNRFGIYQIVLPIVMYMVLLEMGLRAAISRFASKNINSRNNDALNSVISTSTAFCLITSVIILLLSCLLGLFIQPFFNIPEEYFRQTFFMFIGLGINTGLGFMTYGFTGVLIGHNRYELVNLRLLINSIASAGLVVFFFSLGWISLSAWASAITIASLLGLVFNVFAAYRVHPGLSIKFRYINIHTVREIFQFSAWNILIQLSYFLGLNANNLILGRLLGPVIVPIYSVPFMLVSRLQDLVAGMTTTLVPMASSVLNSNDFVFLGRLLRKGTYVSALIVFPLGSVLMVMARDLFRVWLPGGFENSWIVLIILMPAFLFSITQTTSYHVLLGGGNIKGIAIGYLISSVLGICLSLLFIMRYNLGIFGAASGLIIPKFLIMGIYQAWYASSQAKLRFFSYLHKSYLMPALSIIPSVIVAIAFVLFLPPRNLLFWVLEFAVSLLPFFALLFLGIIENPLYRKNSNRTAASIEIPEAGGLSEK